MPTYSEVENTLNQECGKNSLTAMHCRAVARVAERISSAVNAVSSPPLDIDLVRVAALLHDIAKGQSNHAQAGAMRLKNLGFSETLGKAVAHHADFEPVPGSRITETEIVYLADKFVKGTDIVSLENRFEGKYDFFGDKPGGWEEVDRRRKQAEKIRTRIEQKIGQNVFQLIEDL